MELKKILTGIEGLKAKGNLELEIPKITSDSREVKTGDLFVAIKGFDVDGVKFIPAAVEAGAKAILVNEESVKDVIKVIPEDVALITAPDTRIALAKCACNYYDNPSRKFQLIGVTGTKGKTTTTFMIKKILEKHGIKTGLVGTIATYIGDKKIEDSDRTTPDSLKLQGFFAQMAEEGCQAVVMEVSSQSLKLHRVDGSDFNIGVFTNFSEDHISPKEHPDMQDYFNAKLRLFKMCPTGFVNVDDIATVRVPKLVPTKLSLGIDNIDICCVLGLYFTTIIVSVIFLLCPKHNTYISSKLCVLSALLPITVVTIPFIPPPFFCTL